MFKDHADMVQKLVKPEGDIQESITPEKLGLIHMIMGIAGESGELLDAVKKHFAYDKLLDIENVIEELGDIEFYLEGFRQCLGLSRDQIIQANIDKLSVRYSKGSFSNEQANDRADKS